MPVPPPSLCSCGLRTDSHSGACVTSLREPASPDWELLPLLLRFVRASGCTGWFRGVLRLPDELKQNCVDDIVDLMPRFVELLSSEHQAVVTEAASVVANIAASPGENSSSRVIDSGAVPLLIKLLGSTDNNDLKDHAALALGNVAIGSAQARNHVIDSDGLEPLLKVMDDFVEGQSTSARVLNSTVWTVSQLCRAVPRPSVEVLRPVLPVLTQLLVGHIRRCRDRVRDWSASGKDDLCSGTAQEVFDYDSFHEGLLDSAKVFRAHVDLWDRLLADGGVPGRDTDCGLQPAIISFLFVSPPGSAADECERFSGWGGQH